MNAAVLLLLLALAALPASCAPPRSFRLELASVDASAADAANLTEHELLRRAIQRSRYRLAGIGMARGEAASARKAVVAETPIMPAGGEYLVKLGIGTPPYKFTAAIDTASDLIWTQCQPCTGCYHQVDPMFNPRVSSTYAALPCSSDTCDELDVHRCGHDDDESCQYTYTYSGNATTEGTLAVDKLVIGEDAFRGVAFGCSTSSTGGAPPPQASGVVGLGRGPLSLVSQLSVRRYGMIIDIASTITFLEASLYDELVNDLEVEIRLPRGTGSSLGLDLCFILPDGVAFDRVYVPAVALAFDGRWLRLDKARLFAEDRESGMMCLMVGRAEAGSVSILGNFQQQNMQVLYNLRRGRVTFVQSPCGALR
ncbi:hypothetical protein OsJ_14969 [Oryza sativa Japonica Group]|uniref:Peptidase A1 domain-containing protein n=1 Tax=Oryza sativa subsp. japonica TaxID=39947 RepID=B9FFE9_ORYSJ|nr:hypothetical protein OsJ_14969 [Oryza sativa Japonica Group]